MKVIDYKEAMKCLDEVEDCEDKTYAKSLLEWAINKRTFEAVPMSVIEDIKEYVRKELHCKGLFEAKRLQDFIDTKVKEAQVSSDDVVLKFGKGTLKYVNKDYVVFRKDWLKKHVDTEMALYKAKGDKG